MPGEAPKDAKKEAAKEVKEEAPEKKDAAPSEPMSPANQGKWIQSSENNMMQARNLIRDMLTIVRNNEVAESANKEAAQEADKREKEAKKAAVFNKAAAHEKVIATSFKCMQDIEDGILQTEDSLSKLTHERYRGFANLQVCERRLELRSKRPDPEKFRDALTDALTSEKQILEDSRKELLELEAQGKKIVDAMRDKRKFLSEDTGSRRLQMMEDIKTLSPQVAPPPSKSPKASNSPKKGNATSAVEVTFANEATTNGEAETKETTKDGKESTAKEAAKDPKEAEVKDGKEDKPAEEAPKEGEEAPNERPSHSLSPEEQKRAEQASKELIADTLKLLEKCSCHRNKSLETIFKVKQDTNRANNRSEDSLSRRTAELTEMKKQLEKHALDVEAAILRAERSLDRTERRLDTKDAKKVEKFKQDTEALKSLRAVREKLGEDIRNKFAALEIDNMCRRVTAAKASEAKMKQAASNNSLQKSGSAPNLQKKKTGDLAVADEAGEAKEVEKLPDIHQKPGTPPGGKATAGGKPAPKAAAGTPP
eukprot:Skav214875  [mRNA]  locus=scaffold1430:76729:78342:- [translate_table: standard]